MIGRAHPSAAVSAVIGRLGVVGILVAALLGPHGLHTPTARASVPAVGAAASASSDLPPGIDCRAPTFIGIRGSGEQPQGPSSAHTRAQAAARPPYFDPSVTARGMGPALARTVDVLQQHDGVGGGLNVVAVDYPAVPVTFTIPYALGEYRESVDAGVANLDRIVTALVAMCGDATRIVLAGYSQGANVINRYLVAHALDTRALDSIASILFYGDPNARPARVGERLLGTAVDAVGSVSLGFVDGDADIAPYLAARPDVVNSFCIAGDAVCNVAVDPVLGVPLHLAYRSPDTTITCPVTGVANTVLVRCAAFAVMRDLGYRVPATSAEPTAVRRGQQVVLTVGGWTPLAPVTVMLRSTSNVLATAVAGPTGTAGTTVVIPPNTASGPNELVVDQGPGRSAQVPITVVDGGAPSDRPVVSLGRSDGIR